MNMIANFLSTIQNKHQLIFIISFLGTPLMLILYSVFKEKYKYIGEYSPNNNNLFQLGVILTLMSGAFFYIVFDETRIKSLFAIMLFVMFVMCILFLFDFLIDKDKDNANLYKIIFFMLFLFFILTVIVTFMICISMNNIDCRNCIK